MNSVSRRRIEPSTGHWQTREVYLAGGRLNPTESLAVARHSPNGFRWGYGGSRPAQLALAILLGPDGPNVHIWTSW